jgi:hypothetical protein
MHNFPLVLFAHDPRLKLIRRMRLAETITTNSYKIRYVRPKGVTGICGHQNQRAF